VGIVIPVPGYPAGFLNGFSLSFLFYGLFIVFLVFRTVSWLIGDEGQVIEGFLGNRSNIFGTRIGNETMRNVHNRPGLIPWWNVKRSDLDLFPRSYDSRKISFFTECLLNIRVFFVSYHGRKTTLYTSE
jgi:hypothetical protein